MTGGQIRGARVLLFAVLLDCVALSAFSAAAAGETPPAQVVAVRIGFDGHYKVGFWTPVVVTLSGGAEVVSARLEVIVPDGDAVPTRFTAPVELAPGSEVSVLVYVKFGQAEGTLTARLVAGDGRLLAQRQWTSGPRHDGRSIPAAMASTDELYLVVGGPLALSVDPRAAIQTRVVQLDQVAPLPTRWYGYEGIDAVLVTTSQPEILEPLQSQPERVEALARWVQLGGRVVVSAGENAADVLQPGSPLARLLPGTLDRMVPLRRTAPLEAYCDSSPRIETAGLFVLSVPRLAGIEGNVEAYEGTASGELPLVVRAARGFGEIVFVAVDLARPPLDRWPGRGEMLNKLLGRPSRPTDSGQGSGGAVTTLGYEDLSGQLRSALDQFDQVTLVPFWIVGSLVFGYLLLIGPVDYWLVKRVLKRTELTWVTFPAMVVLLSGAAWLAAHALKGRDLQSNQVELVDVDLATGQVRGTLWSNIFSPKSEAYDLTLAPRLPGQPPDAAETSPPDTRPEVLLSWMGLPGQALGGMNAGGSGLTLFEQPYDVAPGSGRMAGVPVAIWSTKALTARWQQQAQLPLRVELREEDDQMVVGKIVNRLGFDLQDARLFYDRWAWPIPLLRDGQTLRIDDDLSPLTSRTLLIQQRIIGQRDAATVYDPASTDIGRIAEIMMLHAVAGGTRYTQGLTNRYQGFTDLSRHLGLGRALLVVAVPEENSRLLRDGRPLAAEGQGRRLTVYRFVIPVQRPDLNP